VTERNNKERTGTGLLSPTYEGLDRLLLIAR
jgi:hypothetical protein